jgi:hypothetical protein
VAIKITSEHMETNNNENKSSVTTYLKNCERTDDGIVLLKQVSLYLGVRGVVGRELKLLDVGSGDDGVRILARALDLHRLIRLGWLPGAVEEVLRVGTVVICDAQTGHLVEVIACQLCIVYQPR